MRFRLPFGLFAISLWALECELSTFAQEPATFDRRIYFKLPLAQPRFHWYFEDEETFLKGELALTVSAPDGKAQKFKIIDNGKISADWETKREADRGIYFLFRSRDTIKLSREYSATVSLRVIEDLDGIGADYTGILRAGTYTSQGRFTIYTPEKRSSEFAYLSKKHWDPHWKLDLTSNKGWMEEKYDQEKIPLTSGPENYQLTFSYKEDGTRSIAIVDHARKEYYFESFRDHESFLDYVVANTDQLPAHIHCTGDGDGFLRLCEELQTKLKSSQLVYFNGDSIVGDRDQFLKFLKGPNYYSIYHAKREEERD